MRTIGLKVNTSTEVEAPVEVETPVEVEETADGVEAPVKRGTSKKK